MDTLKKSDAMNRSSASRSKNQHSFRAVRQTETSLTSVTGPEGARTSRLTFTEDFMMEHSASGIPVALLGVGASGGAAPKQSLPSTQFFGFPS